MKHLQHIGYSLLGALLRALSWLPFWALYGLADLTFLLLLLVGYRRRVVRKNLAESFPDLPSADLRRIERRFYRHFADLIFETIKLGHISDAQIKRRMVFEGVEIVDDLMSRGRSVVAYFSHCGNWEWAPSITLWSRLRPHVDAEFCQVYRPLRNPWVDRYMLCIRSRFNPLSFPKKTVLRDLIRLRQKGMPSITGFMSDQKPSHGDQIHVVPFLNHPTAIITGTEQLARRLDFAVVYWDMQRLRRGHYKITIRLLTDSPDSLPPFALTDRYAEMLQQTIRRDPSIWLWTHKRWKYPVSFPSESTGIVSNLKNS